MKKILSSITLTAMLAGVPAVSLAESQFRVKEGPETCNNAHAVIVASRSGRHDYIWGEIGKVVKRKPYRFKVSGQYEPGVWGSVSFEQYDLEYVEGGTAYVAHCGHGGTCNQLIQDFFAEHDDWYSPEVFCGAVPDGLDNGQSVSP